MATNVSIDAIADAMVTQLTTGMPALRSVARFMGGEFSTPEGFKRGIAGRTPAARVRWAGTKTLRTHMSRKVDRVESSIQVLVVSDSHRSKDDRKALLAVAEGVRALLGDRQLGLAINPLRFRAMDTVRDDEQAMALGLTFTVRHRVDYSISAGTDTINDARGSIINAAVAHTSIPHAPTVTPQGTPGSTSWGYAIVGIDADGLRTLISPTGSTATGAATVNGVNYNRVTWAAYPGIVSYEISRVSAGGSPATTGVIGTTTSLAFNDTGLTVLNATTPDSLHVDTHEVYP